MRTRLRKGIRKQLGQGMSEYIIITALVAVAGIGLFAAFGVRSTESDGQHEPRNGRTVGQPGHHERSELGDDGPNARRAGPTASPRTTNKRMREAATNTATEPEH